MAHFQYELRTRYSETAQDGIIHHSSYAVYLEVARCEFLKTLGYDINQLEKQKILCPVVDLSLNYLKPLHSFDDILILVWADECSKVRFSLKYELLCRGILTTTGRTSHCFLNEWFKPIAIPYNLTKQLEALSNRK